MAVKRRESCDLLLPFFSCAAMEERRDLAKEKGEEKWEAENKKSRTKEVDAWSCRKKRGNMVLKDFWFGCSGSGWLSVCEAGGVG